MESTIEKILFLLIKSREVNEHDQCYKNILAGFGEI